MRPPFPLVALSILSLAAVSACASEPPPPPYTEYRAVAVGGSHTCALTKATEVLCWGDNATGQLGNGTTTSSAKPVPISGNLKFSKISAGATHTCGVSQGEVYCWGSNAHGEIGNGAGPNGAPVTAPARIKGPANASYIDAVAGRSFSCAVTKLGAALCWGQNGFGKLGLGSSHPVGRFAEDAGAADEAVAAPTPVAGRTVFLSISAHDNNACGLSSSNQVFCWGSNLYFQVGATTSDACQVGTSPRWPCAWSPTLTAQRRSTSVPSGLAVGDDFACFIDDHADVYCWGKNDHEQIAAKGGGLPVCKFADDTSTECAPSPRKVARPAGATPIGFARVAAGSDWLCAAMQPAGAAVHCWGLNTGGQLGDGQTANRATPAPISGGLSASEISAGEAHTCIVTSGSNPNRVYCWGANAAGQLGNGAATPRETTPQLVVER
jgi:alpha-tubulin suppressor-like RCC1 family protein